MSEYITIVCNLTFNNKKTIDIFGLIFSRPSLLINYISHTVAFHSLIETEKKFKILSKTKYWKYLKSMNKTYPLIRISAAV